MNDGEWHDRITAILSVTASPLAGFALSWWVGFDNWYTLIGTILCGLFCLAGWFINPDLDLIGLTSAETNWRKRLGVLGGILMGIWFLLWITYAEIVNRVSVFGRRGHRSPLSHWPVIGTAGRVAYLYGIILALSKLARVDLPTFDWRWYLIAFTGLAISDAGHWARDVITSWGKQK